MEEEKVRYYHPKIQNVEAFHSTPLQKDDRVLVVLFQGGEPQNLSFGEYLSYLKATYQEYREEYKVRGNSEGVFQGLAVDGVVVITFRAQMLLGQDMGQNNSAQNPIEELQSPQAHKPQRILSGAGNVNILKKPAGKHDRLR